MPKIPNMLTEFLSFWCPKRLKWLTWWWVGSDWVVFMGLITLNLVIREARIPPSTDRLIWEILQEHLLRPDLGLLGSTWLSLLLCELFGALGMINPASFSPSSPWGAEEWSNPIIILTHFFRTDLIAVILHIFLLVSCHNFHDISTV